MSIRLSGPFTPAPGRLVPAVLPARVPEPGGVLVEPVSPVDPVETADLVGPGALR